MHSILVLIVSAVAKEIANHNDMSSRGSVVLSVKYVLSMLAVYVECNYMDSGNLIGV